MDEDKHRIKREVDCREFLEKAPKGGYVCPVCESGTGQHGTGGVKYYPATNSWYCHVCGRGGDVITLYSIVNGCGFKQALQDLEERSGTSQPFFSNRKKPQPAAIVKKDNTTYYMDCATRLESNEGKPGREYILQRGISLETALEHRIGFDPLSDPAGAGYPCPRIIAPCSPRYYVARRIDGIEDYKKMGPSGVTPQPYNFGVIRDETVYDIFIVEGIFDALSFLEFHINAISLNSKNNIKSFTKLFTQNIINLSQNRKYYIALDNDEAGRNGAKELYYILHNNLNMKCNICENIYKDYKDANDFIIADRDGFIQSIFHTLECSN